MRLILPERHLQPSRRLLWGLALLASLCTFLAWPAAGRWALFLWAAFAPFFLWALRYVAGSWVRISPQRGLSFCLKGLRGTRLGSVELHPSEIAELRLEASLGARILGLWDLQIVKRDGTLLPRLRFFQGMDRVAEEVHAYLHQL